MVTRSASGVIGRLLGAVALFGGAAAGEAHATNAHAFGFIAIDGEALPMASLKGKVVLVVNTASQCGFTGQYAGLQELHARYKDRGFVVLGVPSNDFGGQEPGSEAEIKQFCEVNYDIDFPMTAKVTVAGDQAHPFYRWAAKELGTTAKPRWNFHKYLVDGEGRLVDWFSTVTPPTSARVTQAIEKLLPR
jgi:glutathione peroxidase